MAYSCQQKAWSSMTQSNNLAAVDKRIADAKQAEAGTGSQTQAGDAGQQKQVQQDQQNGPNQAQAGQDKPNDPKAQPDAGKAAPAAQP